MITFPAYVSHVRTMADGSLRIQFDTQELSPDRMTDVFLAHKEVGLVAFVSSKEEFTDEEFAFLEELGNNVKGKDSPSKLMRNALFGLWQRTQFDSGEDDIPPFDKWYEDKMLEWIEIIKKK